MNLTFFMCLYALILDYVKNNPHLGDEPVDIEDLIKIGRTFGP